MPYDSRLTGETIMLGQIFVLISVVLSADSSSALGNVQDLARTSIAPAQQTLTATSAVAETAAGFPPRFAGPEIGDHQCVGDSARPASPVSGPSPLPTSHSAWSIWQAKQASHRFGERSTGKINPLDLASRMSHPWRTPPAVSRPNHLRAVHHWVTDIRRGFVMRTSLYGL